MTIEQAISIMEFAKGTDIKVTFYESAGMWAVAYGNTITKDAGRAFRDLRNLENEVCNVA